jgi:hypothetical protein
VQLLAQLRTFVFPSIDKNTHLRVAEIEIILTLSHLVRSGDQIMNATEDIKQNNYYHWLARKIMHGLRLYSGKIIVIVTSI